MHDMHGYSNLIFGYVAKHSAVRGVRIHPLCEELFIEFMVCFSLLRCDLQGIFFHGSHGARWFLVPKLFRENPVVTMCMVYHGEYLLASQSRIQFEEMLIDTWVGRMYREILDLL
jgi:hypothetical protein